MCVHVCFSAGSSDYQKLDQSLDEEALEAVALAKDGEKEDYLPQMRVSESPIIGEESETPEDVTDEDVLEKEERVASQRTRVTEDHDELTITSHLDDADESETV
jgi:hypothetical protein